MQLRQVYIEITNGCNLSCSFCIQKHEKVRFLNVEQFRFILKQVKPYTRYVYLHILGEPLMHPQLKEILTICKEEEMYVQLTTNGTLLKDQVQLLQELPVRQINISIHSFSQQDSKIQEQYLKNVLESADLLSEKTFISYRLWCLKDGKLDSEANKIYEQILSHYHCDTLSKNSAVAKNRYVSFDEVFEWPSLDHSVLATRGRCRGLLHMIGILSSGDVVPCCLDAYGQAKLGNIFEEDLDVILKNEQANQIRQGFLENTLYAPLCQRCQYRLRFDKKN